MARSFLFLSFGNVINVPLLFSLIRQGVINIPFCFYLLTASQSSWRLIILGISLKYSFLLFSNNLLEHFRTPKCTRVCVQRNEKFMQIFPFIDNAGYLFQNLAGIIIIPALKKCVQLIVKFFWLALTYLSIFRGPRNVRQ